MKKYCVYVHTNKTNGKKYVGITCRPPKERWHGGANYKSNSYFYNSIKKYGWDGFVHDVVATDLSHENACAMEINLIAKYQSNNPKYGYNKSNGGEGHDSISPSMRRNMSKAAKKRFEDPEVRRWNSEKGKKQFSTPEAIEADRQTQIQYLKEHPEKRYVLARPINQYGLDGQFLRSWKSVQDALNEYGSIGISGACTNKYRRKTAGGFMWRYADDANGTDNIEPVQYCDCCRAINQYSLDGKFIRRWKGISVAEKTLGIRNLSEVCNGRRRKAAGYMWRFVDLEDRKQIEPYRRVDYGTQNKTIRN